MLSMLTYAFQQYTEQKTSCSLFIPLSNNFLYRSQKTIHFRIRSNGYSQIIVNARIGKISDKNVLLAQFFKQMCSWNGFMCRKNKICHRISKRKTKLRKCLFGALSCCNNLRCSLLKNNPDLITQQRQVLRINESSDNC